MLGLFLNSDLISQAVKPAHRYGNGKSYQELKSNPSLLHESIRYVVEYPLSGSFNFAVLATSKANAK
jgi:hypothetical protein